MKLYLAIFFGFVFTSILGSILIEGTRYVTADWLGYENQYFSGFGTNLFHKHKTYSEIYKWNESGLNILDPKEADLDKKNQTNLAIIDASAILLVLVFFVIGIILLKQRRKKNAMNVANWIGFFLSLIYLRYLVRHSITIYSGRIVCQETSLFRELHLPILTSVYVLYGLGIIVAFLIVWQLPKHLRFKSIGIGALGGVLLH